MSTDAFHDSPEINAMSQVSIDLSARARKGNSRVLNALARAKESVLAAELGVDPATLSRKKTDRKNNGLTEIEWFCSLLERLGLKIVPQHYQSYDRAQVEAWFTLARAYMGRAETVDDFFHDELEERDDLGY